MKTIFIALALSTSAFSATLPTANDKLESILLSPLVKVQMPTVLMKFEDGSTMQNITDVCLEGSNLYLKEKTLRIQIKSNNSKNPTNKFKIVTPVAPLDYNERVCSKWHKIQKPKSTICIAYEDRNVTIATSYDLEVRELIKRSNQRNSKLRFPGPVIFTKAFSISLCK
jgi:hypothetical protein